MEAVRFREPPDVLKAGGKTTGEAKQRRVPLRTCVACRSASGKRALVRVIRLPDGAGVEVDPSGKRSGRGAYVCPTAVCVALALKQKKLERSLKTPIPEAVADALRALAAEAAAWTPPEQPPPTSAAPDTTTGSARQ